jgi:hypothetical protein
VLPGVRTTYEIANIGREAIRLLKRKLANVVYRTPAA